jgi:asparagine synthase (glutamine-hydrolysing)
MCGICGVFEYERRTDLPTAMVHKMNQTMIHRGPDDGGVFVGPGIGLYTGG